jgi:hypothetical protein
MEEEEQEGAPMKQEGRRGCSAFDFDFDFGEEREAASWRAGAAPGAAQPPCREV